MAAMPADAGNVMTRARAIGFICPPVGGAVNNADAQDGTDEDVRRGNWQAQQGSGHNHADSAQQVYRVVVQLGEESTAAPAAAAPERTAPLRSRSTRRHASRGETRPCGSCGEWSTPRNSADVRLAGGSQPHLPANAHWQGTSHMSLSR